MPARFVRRPAGGEIAQAQARDRLDETRLGEVRFDRKRLSRAHQRFVWAVEPAQGRCAVGKQRCVVRREDKEAFIGSDGLLHPIESEQRIAPIPKRVGVLRTYSEHPIEACERLARPSQFEERHALPVEKLGIAGLESKSLLEAIERAGKIPQRQEDKSESGKAFGARQIAFQRFLKTGKRAVEPSTTAMDLPEAVQRIEAVRLML